ncbi:hypothetical protein ASG74_02955 [Knoellia sp. Soil729]|nr:hypothetical protein ASG74_02955 [Knoellia sp. Soil729]
MSDTPQVVIGSSPNLFAALAAYAMARRQGALFILEVRDIWPSSVIELMGVKGWHPFVLLLSSMERFLYRRADQIVGLMDGLESHVESVIGPSHPPVAWIPNGVDLRRFAIVAASAADTDQPFTLVYAGAHGVPNSLDTAIEAMRELSGEPIQLHLYGSGVSKEYLQRQAADLPAVVFHDAVPKTEIPHILHAASALLICWRDSPLYSRGVSANKLFDYLASGRPIAQSYSGANDIVEASGAGVTVPAEDPRSLARAILRLSRMPSPELDDMGERGKSWVRDHRSIDVLAERFRSLFSSSV